MTLIQLELDIPAERTTISEGERDTRAVLAKLARERFSPEVTYDGGAVLDFLAAARHMLRLGHPEHYYLCEACGENQWQSYWIEQEIARIGA